MATIYKINFQLTNQTRPYLKDSKIYIESLRNLEEAKLKMKKLNKLKEIIYTNISRTN